MPRYATGHHATRSGCRCVGSNGPRHSGRCYRRSFGRTLQILDGSCARPASRGARNRRAPTDRCGSAPVVRPPVVSHLGSLPGCRSRSREGAASGPGRSSRCAGRSPRRPDSRWRCRYSLLSGCVGTSAPCREAALRTMTAQCGRSPRCPVPGPRNRTAPWRRTRESNRGPSCWTRTSTPPLRGSPSRTKGRAGSTVPPSDGETRVIARLPLHRATLPTSTPAPAGHR